MSKKEEALRTMNRLGASGKPFLFVIDFDAAAPVVISAEEASGAGILYDFNGVTNAPQAVPGRGPSYFRPHPVPRGRYEASFGRIMEGLNRGDSYLANLTFPTPVETDLTLPDLFTCARAKYRLLFGDRFVCFSPETFVRIVDGTISSHPMKGTIDADLPDARGAILADPKELAEHTTIVDLIRNDLNTVASDVRVSRFRYIDTIRTNGKPLLQVSSEITGRLPGDYPERIGSIVFGMLPAGSVTGAPKKKTVEIIREAEIDRRGFYTGVAGYYDGRDLDSCVLIRYIERTGTGLVYRSGGGITVDSDPESEYREMVDKVYVPLV